VQALGPGSTASRPAGAETERHRDEPARRARRAVSEAALASMLALVTQPAGRGPRADEHQWRRWPAKLLHDKTVGILGIGVIAEALAPKCKPWNDGSRRHVVTAQGRWLRPRASDGELLVVLPQLDYLVLLTPIRGDHT